MVQAFIQSVIILGISMAILAAPVESQEQPIECNTPMIEWAKKYSQDTDEPRIAHIYRPAAQNLNEDEISISLYAQIMVHCPSGCLVNDDDRAMYTFYRSTHYWELEKVFREVFDCGSSPIEESLDEPGNTISLRRVIDSELNLTAYWNARQCALPGAGPMDRPGCISIEVRP